MAKINRAKINAVGYELYLELLEEAIANLKGEPVDESVDPEINLKIPAYIPDKYISDIRVRLAFYKALSDVDSSEDIDKIEEDLHDQFGRPPEEVLNLIGVMLIRSSCKKLLIKDLTATSKALSLRFSENTPLSVDKVLRLTQRADKKYSLTPDSRLLIRIKEITWPRVYEELMFLLGV